MISACRDISMPRFPSFNSPLEASASSFALIRMRSLSRGFYRDFPEILRLSSSKAAICELPLAIIVRRAKKVMLFDHEGATYSTSSTRLIMLFKNIFNRKFRRTSFSFLLERFFPVEKWLASCLADR